MPGPPRNPDVELQCPACKQGFIVRFNVRKYRIYCSRKCNASQNKVRVPGGEKSKLFRNPNNHHQYRKKAFAHYGYTCAKCGATNGNFAKTHRGFIVHHKDHNRQNQAIENLEVLCQGCHLREHRAGPEFRAKMRTVALAHDYASHFRKA